MNHMTKTAQTAAHPEPWWFHGPVGSIGVLVTTQAEADDRVRQLLDASVASRFIRVAPHEPITLDRIGGKAAWEHMSRSAIRREWPGLIELRGIDRVIVAGQTGLNAWPVHPDWVRDLRNEAIKARVSFVFDGWGDYIPRSHTNERKPWHADQIPDGWRVMIDRECEWGTISADGTWWPSTTPWNGHDDDGHGEAVMIRVGGRRSGRMLDGVEHRGEAVR